MRTVVHVHVCAVSDGVAGSSCRKTKVSSQDWHRINFSWSSITEEFVWNNNKRTSYIFPVLKKCYSSFLPHVWPGWVVASGTGCGVAGCCSMPTSGNLEDPTRGAKWLYFPRTRSMALLLSWEVLCSRSVLCLGFGTTPNMTGCGSLSR